MTNNAVVLSSSTPLQTRRRMCPLPRPHSNPPHRPHPHPPPQQAEPPAVWEARGSTRRLTPQTGRVSRCHSQSTSHQPMCSTTSFQMSPVRRRRAPHPFRDIDDENERVPSLFFSFTVFVSRCFCVFLLLLEFDFWEFKRRADNEGQAGNKKDV